MRRLTGRLCMQVETRPCWRCSRLESFMAIRTLWLELHGQWVRLPLRPVPPHLRAWRRDAAACLTEAPRQQGDCGQEHGSSGQSREEAYSATEENAFSGGGRKGVMRSEIMACEGGTHVLHCVKARPVGEVPGKLARRAAEVGAVVEPVCARRTWGV